MSVFPNIHPERIAPGSFQQPVVVPTPLPGASPLVQVCFNADWLPYILGCLFQLTLNTTWLATDADLDQILGEANNLILIFQRAANGCPARNAGTSGAGDDFMLRQDPDNPCLLQTSVDGVNWCTWADISKCTPAAQPASGSPQPKAGQCEKFSGTLTPTGAWLLPVLVSSGDQVTVSNLIGAWTPTAFTGIWDCPDGNLYFDGICVDGTAGHDAGAPDPSAPLNGTLLFDGTNFYDVSAAANAGTPVTVTILPGITNQQLIVRSNFHGGVEPAGEVNFDIQICKAVSSTFTHTFDFTSNPNPFVFSINSGQQEGHWVAGTGLVFSDVTGLPQTIRVVEGNIALAARTLTNITLKVAFTNGLNDANPTVPLQHIDTNIGSVFTNSGGSGPTGSNVTISTDISQVGVTNIHLELISDDTNSPPTGNIVVKQLIVSGLGTDPF